MNLSKSLILTSAALLSLTTVAGASTLPISQIAKPTTTVFGVSGQFSNSAVLSGSFDVTSGQISSANISISGIQGSFTLDNGGNYSGNGIWGNVDLNDGGNFLELDLVLANGATNLNNYNGGALCVASGNCGRVSSYYLPSVDRDPLLTAGSVTAASLAPEPDSIALLGAGLSAFALILRRRFLKK